MLTALGVDSAAVCGHSYGGWLALTRAPHAPARVRQLALEHPSWDDAEGRRGARRSPKSRDRLTAGRAFTG
ncbi:alpha/beta fold hydrolase [Nonomuraea sp. NPDC003804]|uniref:alpha/beta fold hydrolase n=1 Tax=Nonomuraea sp. NPDC003804 TaxID=3154547 RepID=UPI0033A67A1D